MRFFSGIRRVNVSVVFDIGLILVPIVTVSRSFIAREIIQYLTENARPIRDDARRDWKCLQ